MTQKTFTTLEVTGIRHETKDTKTFILEPQDDKLLYEPGQFLTLLFPDKVNESRRSYSISSSQRLGEPLSITVKRIDNGEFSRYLFDYCQIGFPLYTIGVFGFFTLPPNLALYECVVFYAAGSGIAPVLPMVKVILAFFPGLKVKLVYSNHSVEWAIFYSELKDLEGRYSPSFSIEWLFSDHINLLQARLTKTLIQEHVDRLPPGTKSKTLFYMCGPYDYMQMISITLLREGISRENIKKEIFDTVKPLVKDLPPDQDVHEVTVRYSGTTHHYRVQYPVTILEGAKRNGLVLPYSCEAGKCGTCSATCTDGSIWMSYNEVLSDKEVEKGRVLTCTGFPIGGDVTVEFE